MIALSKLDDRYFIDLSGRYMWMLGFVIYKHGSPEIVAESHVPRFWSRSVTVEVDLEPGDYVVHVRLDRHLLRAKGYLESQINETNMRKYSKILAERDRSRSIATNYTPDPAHTPSPVDSLAGLSLTEYETKQRQVVVEDEVDQDDEESPLDETEDGEYDPDDVIFLGLRVYTDKSAPATIKGQLRVSQY
ncbi:hypothetical protein HGRIS_004213 [Hohenbuehelia grisea]|uniref:Uncharacterized protein n=1 Tax=Hohenbuehelia grisea TaxID=104357 RepID=A0ABR3JJ28_9AGAR